MGLKCPKTFSHLVAKSAMEQASFGHFRPILGQKIDPKPTIGHLFLKRIHQKNFCSNSQYLAKVMVMSPGGQTFPKKKLTFGQLRNAHK